MRLLKDKKKILYLIPIIVLAILVLYIYKYDLVFLDSDASSELVLDSILNKTGSLISKKWNYSTEIEIIDTNTIFPILFSFFNSWKVIRAIGTGICMLLMMLSAIFFYHELGIKNKAILVSLLILPISVQYFGMYIAHPYYEFVAIKAFLYLGLLLKILKDEKKKIVVNICFVLLSMLMGLDGLRNILIVIIPIFVSYLLLESLNQFKLLDDSWVYICKKSRKIVLISLISCAVGYLINTKVIANIYSFSSFNDMVFKYIDMESIKTASNSWLQTFGFIDGTVISTTLIHVGFSFIIVGLTLVLIVDNIIHFKSIKKSTAIITIYYLIAATVLTCISIFVKYTSSEIDIIRYNLHIVIVAIPLVFDWFENRFNLNRISKTAFIVFVCLYTLCGLDNLNIYRNNDNKEVFKNINTWRENKDNIELNDIVYMLNEQGYENGYGYFWNGNIITELSNGNIEMWIWANGGSHTTELTDINSMYNWLQLKSHNTDHPKNEVFLIFSEEELEYSKITKKLNWDNAIYNSNNYTVYGYNSYEELMEDFNN